MSALLLWLCFFAVLAGIGLSLVVLVRELRRQVAVRRASALGTADKRESEPAGVAAAAAVTAAPNKADAARVTASAAQRSSVAVPAARRGLGAPGQGSGTPPRRPVSGRGLGSATPVPPRPGRSTHRGLGRRPHA